MKENVFSNKKVNFDKIIKYGFVKNDTGYIFVKNIMNGDFRFEMNVFNSGEIKTAVIENSTNEIYTLHLVQEADGSFVGKLREEYEFVLNDIISKCFDNEVFKNTYTHKVIDFVRKKYGDDPEYLWPKFPNNAIFRNKKTKKWYAAILTAKKSNFGYKSDDMEEVIDLRARDLETFVDNIKYFPGYHMNKKSWITILLDGSVSINEISKRIDDSYKLSS